MVSNHDRHTQCCGTNDNPIVAAMALPSSPVFSTPRMESLSLRARLSQASRPKVKMPCTSWTPFVAGVCHLWRNGLRSWARSVCARGCHYTTSPSDLLMRNTDARPPGVMDAYHITDGRLVTGTNPASATETATAAVQAFENL